MSSNIVCSPHILHRVQQLPHSAIKPVADHQLTMLTLLHNLTLLKHKNPVILP